MKQSNHIFAALLIAWVGLVIAACRLLPSTGKEAAPLNPQSPAPENMTSTTPDNLSEPGRTPQPEAMSSPPPVEKFVTLAKKDLAEHLRINISQIALQKTVEMVWPNTALGCPSPGKVYPTGKIPGYQISLVANHVEYLYNTDWSGQVILCLKRGPDDSLEPVTTVGPEIGVPIK